MIEDRLYTEKQVARIAEVDCYTLRRWHRDGIARASSRTAGKGHRRYTMQDVRRVVIVAALRSAKRCAYRDLAKQAEAIEQREALWGYAQ